MSRAGFGEQPSLGHGEEIARIGKAADGAGEAAVAVGAAGAIAMRHVNPMTGWRTTAIKEGPTVPCNTRTSTASP